MTISNNMAANASAVIAKLNAKTLPPGPKIKKRVKPLKCAEIRWFLRKDSDPNKWVPLRGYDSLVLEVAFREHSGIPLDEEAQSIRDQLPETPHPIVLDGLYFLEDWDPSKLDWSLKSIYWKDEENTIIVVRRGTWFNLDSLQPLQMNLSDAIEAHHLKHFMDQAIPEVLVFSESEVSKLPVLTSLEWSEYEEVRWNSVIDISLHNTKGNRLTRLFRGKGTTLLRRGYKEDARVDDGKPNFSDLILVVHGIGQKGYENLIAENTTQMREGITQIMDKYYSSEPRRPMVLPVEWRNCLKLDDGALEVITLPRMQSMRHALNSIAMDIMYYQSPLYRTEVVNGVNRCLNKTYTMFVKNNPGFNGSVSIFAHSLGSVIAYDIITNWSPLLLYDEFVTNAIKEQLKELDENKDKKEFEVLQQFHESRKALLTDGKLHEILLKREENLKFKVKNLFCVGSPLAIFLIMRGADIKTLIPPSHQVERIFNIFHPYDPMAYRLEPLFHENYRLIRPIKLFYYADERALQPYWNLPFECHKSYLNLAKKKFKKFTNDKNAPQDDDEEVDEVDSDSGECSATSSPRSQSPYMSDDMQENRIPPERPPPPKPGTSSSWWKFGSSGAAAAAQTSKLPDGYEIEISQEPEPSKPMSVVESLLNGIPAERKIPMRLDFQTQSSLTEKSYWSMLRSHFGYLDEFRPFLMNLDTIGFVLNVIYSNPPKEKDLVDKIKDVIKEAKNPKKEPVKASIPKENVKVEEKASSSADNKSVGGESKGSVEAELEDIQKELKENTQVSSQSHSLYPSLT